MRISSQLRKQINQAVRDNVGGASPFAEAGNRAGMDGQLTTNMLDVPDNHDLFDFEPVRALRQVADSASFPGCALLDLYVTSGTGANRELETNVWVAIKDGEVVAAMDTHRQTLEHGLNPLFEAMGLEPTRVTRVFDGQCNVANCRECKDATATG